MLTGRFWLITLLVAVAVGLGAGVVWAQETDDDVQKQSLWSIINAGGIIGWVIIGLSFVSLGLIIEHFTSIKDDKLIPPDFVAALQTSIEEKKYQDAMQLCEASDNYISRIMMVGLSEIRYGYEAMVESMSTIGEEESIKLNQKIGYLSLIGTVAPMLGLLGTVTGMIYAFKKIAEMPVTDAKMLAGGIYMALVTTVEGLTVALPTMFFYSFFQDRVTNIGLEAGAVCEELVRKFKPVKVSGVDVPAGRPAVRQKPQAGAGPAQSS